MFPVYIAYIVTIWAYLAVLFGIASGAGNTPPPEPAETAATMLQICIAAVCYSVVWLLPGYRIYKLFIEGIEYKGETLQCRISLGRHLRVLLKGVLLSIVTLGVYSPWFTASLTRFFVDNTYHKDEPTRFHGTGSYLFAIITLGFLLPYITVCIVFGILAGTSPTLTLVLYPVLIFVAFFLTSLLTYLTYKWQIDISFRGCRANLAGNIFKGTFYILGQTLLAVVTLLFYMPAANLRIYNYLVTHTRISQEDGLFRIRIGYDVNIGRDYGYILAQRLLCSLHWVYMNPGPLQRSPGGSPASLTSKKRTKIRSDRLSRPIPKAEKVLRFFYSPSPQLSFPDDCHCFFQARPYGSGLFIANQTAAAQPKPGNTAKHRSIKILYVENQNNKSHTSIFTKKSAGKHQAENKKNDKFINRKSLLNFFKF